MGLRERAAGLSVLGGARQKAPKDLYKSTWTIVPSLQWPSRKASSTAAHEVAVNPLLFSPTYRLAMRMGALPIKVYGLLPPEEQPDQEGDVLDPTGVVVPLPNRMQRLQQMDSNMRSTLAREETPLHPGALLLHKPNPLMDRHQLMAGTVAQMFTHGHAGWLKDRNAKGRPPEELWPLPGQFLKPVRDARSIISGFVLHPGTAEEVELPFEDVCYFRLMPGFSDWAGSTAPIQALADVADYGGAAIDAMTQLFDTGILSPLWIDLHGKTLSNRNQGRLQRQMDAARRDKYGIPVMEDGATLEQLGDGPSDEILARSASSAEAIIREAFGFPKDDDIKAFYAQAVQPVADAIEQELVRSLFPEWEETPAFAEFQYREILKGTPAERIELHSKAILSAQETPNEARRDENRPPIRGLDEAFLPLNVIPASKSGETAERPPSDSGEGLGGDEGKDTFPSANDDVPDVGPPAATARARWRARFRAGWGTQRGRVIERQSAGFENRARSLLKRELADLRKTMFPDGRGTRARKGKDRIGGFPEGQELVAIIRETEPDLARQLEAHMDNTSELAYRQAAELLSMEAVDIERIVRDTLRDRAEAVAARFTDVRVEAVEGLLTSGLEKGWTVRELDTAIAERYSGLATHFVDGIGRTEMAFAYERAAYGAWLQGGVQQLEYVFGGGPCTTGMCEEAAESGPVMLGTEPGRNAGESFDQTLTPPLHPGCTCFMVPLVEQEGVAEA